MSSDYQNVRKVSDQRLIAGYLRDALLNRYPCSISIGPITVEGVIEKVEEKSSRARTGLRKVVFKIPRLPAQLAATSKIKLEAEVRLSTDRFLMRFKAQVSKFVTQGVTLRIPEEMLIIYKRKHYRFSAKNLQRNVTDVVIEIPNGTSKFGVLSIHDISSYGIGGELIVNGSIKNIRGATIRGKFVQPEGAIPLIGTIIWAQEEGGSSKHLTQFQVGISDKQVTIKNSTPSSDEVDRRRYTRLTITFPIEVVSPLFPQTPCVLQLLDLSLLGMKGKLINNADRVVFRVGLEVSLCNPRLTMRVQAVLGNIVSFRILPSSLVEHIKLFNLKSSLGHQDLATGTPISSDLLQVYTSSGSVSSFLAKSLSAFRSLLQQSASIYLTANWLLRWIQQTESGLIRAIVLTVPYGDHVWYNGGLASHLDPELRMSVDFLPRYYLALREFFSSLGSSEYLLFNWFTDNPRWPEWDKNLDMQKKNKLLLRFKGDIIYFENSGLIKSSELTKRKLLQPIDEQNFDLSSIFARIDNPDLKHLFNLLGLNQFGALKLQQFFYSLGYRFLRKFYYATINNKLILVMFNTFPSFSSPNSIVNYPFLYSNRHLNENELTIISTQIREICTILGVECPAFFLTIDGKSLKKQKFKGLKSREVVWTFGPPDRVLSYWRSP